MTDRTATDTIKGYFYQFDLSILKLLELKDENHKITVEGIEDIDIDNATIETAVQCKYHSKTEYNHSVIAKPIRLMLNHFREVLNGKEKRINYNYYGHFKTGQSKLTLPLTLDFLKDKLLTYKKDKKIHKHYDELKLSDKELLDFINQLEINVNAQSYEDQLLQIHNLLKNQTEFSSDDFEAENYFYNNALKLISFLAIKEKKTDRTISKKKFLEDINSKKILFHKWFIEYKGRKKLLADLRKEFFTIYNISPFERFFLFEVNPNYSKSDLKSVIHLISKKWTDIKSAKNPDTFCPYIYINGLKKSDLITLKTELYTEGYKINDGYAFSGSTFNISLIKEKATFHNQIKFKIINELNFIELLLSEISKTKEVYQFFYKKPFFTTAITSVNVVNIQIEELNDIKKII
ncbi:hypothetical protein BWZ20_00555 [Winogradskyella sp. J14-2]|uniref:DUF4297 family anti-phage-associated protein n=1 Tax=Winogradskyella sp. J14-2 TaxID=1936080 RepID=UPI0009727DCA|nr:DUF4297 family anti-phage-associated protein [Winogradskyella sp. J14-2]APY06877.1 hypothetical protein BWZ20_00555 [Winogradskyella sp. J14-2]